MSFACEFKTHYTYLFKRRRCLNMKMIFQYLKTLITQVKTIKKSQDFHHIDYKSKETLKIKTNL